MPSTIGYSLGLDVGGTKIEAAVIAFSGKKMKVLSRVRMPTERIKGKAHILKTIAEVAASAIEESKIPMKKITAVGIGLPGSVHPKTGKMIFGNTNSIAGVDFKKFIRKIFKNPKLKVVTENDANCFAYAEAHFGVGKKYPKNGIGLILGTGVGGGIILDGKILKGKTGGGGEVGHTELYTGGIACYCGSSGCAENYLSGPSFEAAFTRKSGVKAKSPEIVKRARQGEPAAIAALLQYKKDLAKFIGNLNNVLDTEFVVLGGGMSNIPGLVTGIKAEIQKHCFLPKSAPDVLVNELGDSAGVIGAALLSKKN